ncbi:MAG: ATP-binding protein [Planctomycetota bacterium]|nr:ATP-binding protein [Planctomycetota bacterium]
MSEALLPGALGRASWFGSTAFGHWMDAPADLLLTVIAFGWAAQRVRTWTRDRPRRVAVPVRLLVAILLAWGCLMLPGLFAADTPIDVLDWDDAKPRWVATFLWTAWAALGVATSLAIVDVFGGGERPARRWVAAVLIPWTFLGATLYERALESDARERAESRLLPQLEDPVAERRWALESSLDEAIAGGPPESADAFRLWSRTELGRIGYRSSLEVRAPDGTARSFFSHGLGTFQDPPDASGSEDRLETLDEGTRLREVRHVERVWPDADGGDSGWRLVGHVLEAPDNLPFLAEESAFSRALRGPSERARARTSYVLYDRRGVVLTQTIDRAPPYSRELDLAATRERELDLRIGPDRYRALPRLDDEKVHLLMLRRRSAIGRAARGLRLAFASLVILTLISLIGRKRESQRGWTRWQGSFYRKLLTTLLAASIPPVLGLVWLVQGFLERRAEMEFQQAGVQAVTTAQRGIESLLSLGEDPEPAAPLDDAVVDWLSRLAGRPIHVWRDGRLEASSEREWFDAGLLPDQLPGRVHEDIVQGGFPFALHALPLEDRPLQVAFAPLRHAADDGSRIVGVPLAGSRRAADRTLDRVGEAMLLSAAGLVALLAFAAAALARMVSRPVRALVAASGRLAGGDYSARASSPARDELGELVTSFNVMAGALQEQRVDLERRREYIETLLTHATTGIASIDRHGTIVTANPALHRILGLEPGALSAGDHWTERLADLGLDEGLREKLRRRPDPWLDASEVDLQSAAEGRRLRVVQVRLPAPSGEGDRLILVDDLTDVMRSNQLEAWAEMARAIAHEIKNPLTPIQLSTEHLRRRLTDRGVLPAEDLDRCLETVLKQVEGLREIAGEFGAYAKIPALTLATEDAAEVLREAIEPYRRSPPPGVEIRVAADAARPVRLDRRAFVRSLVNLVENALQALPDGGNLTASCVDRGTHVAFHIEDDGIGIDDATRRRLYEPYFSTKSSGTGLGLAIVRRTVEAHGGTIDVESRPGAGSAFTILLPVADGP